ncbi:MAG: hypothetical protein Kow0077_25200 [Anaerolineae bacterium]
MLEKWEIDPCTGKKTLYNEVTVWARRCGAERINKTEEGRRKHNGKFKSQLDSDVCLWPTKQSVFLFLRKRTLTREE